MLTKKGKVVQGGLMHTDYRLQREGETSMGDGC
jgi:hypothetical protein